MKKTKFYQTFFRIAPIYYLGILYYTVTFIFKLPFGLVRNQRFLHLVLFLISFLHGISPFQSIGSWRLVYRVEYVFYLLSIYFTKIKKH
jgi:hypothetical protein